MPSPHLLWAVPAAVALRVALLILPKPRCERIGSRCVDVAGFPPEPCQAARSWRGLMRPLRPL